MKRILQGIITLLSLSMMMGAAPIPQTGDEGVSITLWIVLGVAVIAVLVMAILPSIAKKKNDDDQNGPQ